MNIEERKNLNKQKLTGIVSRIGNIDAEKEALLQEALRLDGELRILNEQVADKVKKKGETKP